MPAPVKQELSNGVMTLTIDNPPVNALGHAVRAALLAGIVDAEQNPQVRAIVICGAGRTFPAGADIREFGKPPAAPLLPEVVDRIEACSKPVIAALHGTALGGGLEIALGAHYRIAHPDARMGLPEVLLGILPGAGGTQRLPRLIGVQPALDMMTRGKPIPAAKAQSLGLVDRMITSDTLEKDAQEYAQHLITTGAEARRTRDRVDMLQDRSAAEDAINATQQQVEKRMRGQFAPFRIIDCVKAALDGDFDAGMAVERTNFNACMATPERKGMIHAFFAERRTVKVRETADAAPRPLSALGVIGGGTMGAGITVAALDAGLPVIMVEQDAAAAERGRKNVIAVYDRLVSRGRLTPAEKDKRLARFACETRYEALSQTDLIIEAVFEELEVKKSVFARLDQVARPGAVLATNTSYLDIAAIAAATTRPGDVIGLHFFSPANVMKLLEVVVADQTQDDVVATGFALAKRLGKIPVRAGNSDGFIGNRIWRAYGTAAAHMLEDGASPYEIDAALISFGYPMGLHAVYDLAGLDIGWANRKKDAPNRPADQRYVRIADRICENGWFGQKTGRGFYRYPDGARQGVPDPDILAIIDAERAAKGITPRPIPESEIIRRYLAAMVNEGAKVLGEGVAARPSDIDVVHLHGYGFPRYRGGPMKYADMYGLPRLLEDIREFAQGEPGFWSPAPLLEELVAAGEDFDTLNQRSD